MGTRRPSSIAALLAVLLFALCTLASSGQAPAAVQLPNRADSLKFLVLGDFGDGRRPQMQVAAEIAKLRGRFPFELVITVGDNIYGSERPQDMKHKFEDPYKPLLDAGVKFYASLGNHDDRAQAFYKPFNMEGRRYYSFKAPKQDVKFFALESDYPLPKQFQWLENELQSSREDWKIPYFHHPLYSSGEKHGSDLSLRKSLEPLFLEYGVSVVFTGHDHFYERIKPQKGIVHFVVGSGGKLRRNGIDRKTGLTAVGFDTDQAFLAAEIDADQLFFNAISRTGNIVDSGIIERRPQPQP
jgi:predicted MPP superfamily phosphohydrolase